MPKTKRSQIDNTCPQGTVVNHQQMSKHAIGARSSSRFVKNQGAWGHPQQAAGKRYVLKSTLLATLFWK